MKIYKITNYFNFSDIENQYFYKGAASMETIEN